MKLKNQQLKQGFIDIVNGQTPQNPVVEESTQQAQQATESWIQLRQMFIYRKEQKQLEGYIKTKSRV